MSKHIIEELLSEAEKELKELRFNDVIIRYETLKTKIELLRDIVKIQNEEELANASKFTNTSFEDISLSRAIIKLFSETGKQTYSTTEVAEMLKNRGYKTGSKYFRKLVASTLSKLKKKGLISSIGHRDEHFTK